MTGRNLAACDDWKREDYTTSEGVKVRRWVKGRAYIEKHPQAGTYMAVKDGFLGVKPTWNQAADLAEEA